MMFVSLAAAAILSGVPERPHSTPLDDLFERYCRTTDHEPYCRDQVPSSIQWLVLESLCAAFVSGERYGSVCREFFELRAAPQPPRRFLMYDARLDRWAAVRYDQPNDTAWVDVDDTGTATVTRSPREDIPVLIVGINPLVYGTSPETVSSVDLPSLDSLQSLASGIGNALQFAVGVYGRAKHQQADPEALRFLVPPGKRLVMPPRVGALDDEREPDSLLRAIRLRDERLEALSEAAGAMARLVADQAIVRAATIVWIQQLERAVGHADRTALTVTVPRPWPLDGFSATAADATIERLRNAFIEARDFGLACRSQMTAFLRILDSSDRREEASNVAEFLRLAPPTGCDPTIAALVEDIRADAERLCAAAHADGLDVACMGSGAAPTATFSELMRIIDKKYNAGLTVLTTPPPKRGSDPAPLDAAYTLLTSKTLDELKMRFGLVAADARKQEYTFGSDTVMTWIYVTPRTRRLSWNTLQTHTFTLKPWAPLADTVVPLYPAEKRLSYRVQSTRGVVVGAGVGVIYTDIERPTWDAVTDPNAPGRKILRRTDASSVAGQLAAFADWRVVSLITGRAEGWLVRPSLQVGANLTTSAGFFVGVGFDVLKRLRFGIGTTWQQNKRLDGQTEGMAIGGRDDIRRADFFARANYLSLSFALDSLGLFKRAAASSAVYD